VRLRPTFPCHLSWDLIAEKSVKLNFELLHKIKKCKAQGVNTGLNLLLLRTPARRKSVQCDIFGLSGLQELINH